ncbi:site-2 protease family protein [bacterium]|nr:site-2 protease family protein [bacterium]
MNNPLNRYNSHYKYDLEGSGDIIVDLGKNYKPEKFSIPRINIILFILTVISTTIAGAFYFENKDILANPLSIIYGIPFSFSILIILGAHEMGHYIMCRKHGIPATLPYFIPAPFLFGTMGAVIKIKGIMKNRKDLVDVGAWGPISGMLVSIPVLIFGIYISEFKPLPDIQGMSLYFGEPLLFKFLVNLVKGTSPLHQTLYLSSVGLAGWAGLFVTSMNLLPVGQLDGGHILYAVTPKNHRNISKIFTFLLIPLGLIYWNGWITWAVLLVFFVRFNHPKPQYDYVPLDRKRKIIAFITLLLFILTFTPQPIYIQ